ncbi:hypothetical protein [Candidatus Viridilinea mediisalina]|uniref:Uncharacterized protein n=1 Tax=Candidatus Viridilinea mediisalina TaxID=2024553 RepID=A0A2A6RN55_9CHLR|nr:hypothetical protein [Candidatus Viridilinea mediisalina]PDW04356.1 hypothetical protein CJ255_04175 [Candidatus Viridilinea mediisalina]
MAQRSLFWPFSIVIIMVGMILMVLNGAPTQSMTAQSMTCPYPGISDVDCFATQTAQAQPNNPYPSPSPTASNTPTNTPVSAAAVPPQQAVATATATGTPTATATNGANTATPTPTSSPTLTATNGADTNNGADAADAPTPTPTSIDDLAPLICQPGATVNISGITEPNTALLAFFDQRPVGGSFSRSDGSYTIALRIGPERPGIYPIEVRERHGLELVQRLTCEVPGLAATTPTATVVVRGP